jgi:uncharacterized pyridoxamine 5'-phosphate oxidase family protein
LKLLRLAIALPLLDLLHLLLEFLLFGIEQLEPSVAEGQLYLSSSKEAFLFSANDKSLFNQII